MAPKVSEPITESEAAEQYKEYKYDISVEELEAQETEDHRVRMNIGPSHPATHGTLRLKAELDGEIVRKVEPEIGFLHTGFEKLGEHRSWNEFITVTDRMNYISPLNNNIGFAVCVENMMGIEVPKRAQYIRMIMAELSRIGDHLFCIGFLGLDLGAFSILLWTFVEREKLYDLFEEVTGTRLTTSYTRIGGVAMDFPEGFEKRIVEVCDSITEATKEIEVLLDGNRIFTERTQGAGVVTPEAALDYGLTGPVLRSAGIEYDVRTAAPYSSYDEVDFKVPVLHAGDSFARYRIRVLEIYESLSIIQQALAKMPAGPVNHLDQKVTLPSKASTYGDMESLIHHFKIIMPGHGLAAGKNEFYSATEAPNGELGFHLIADGGDAPYRVRVRPPSFINYSIFPELIEGEPLQSFPPILGTLNVIAGELDR